MSNRTVISLVEDASREYGEGRHSSASYLLLLALVGLLSNDVEVHEAVAGAGALAVFPAAPRE